MSVLESPTGLDSRDLQSMTELRLRRLAAWHASVAGKDKGRDWWPRAIRDLSLGQRVEMAEDEVYSAAWQRSEKLACEANPHRFVWGYGHVQPSVGPIIPFDGWPEQEDVLDVFVEESRIVVLKARQLGLTWLALHFGMWMMGQSPETPNARVLALSKNGKDAGKLTVRARTINDALPPFLRIVESRETRGSSRDFALEGRGSMQSLMGTPEAARSETATLIIADEFGHYRNKSAGDTLTALEGTLGEGAKLIAIGTGNGPAEVEGDGQTFAVLFTGAATGESDYAAVFLPSSSHPDRTPEWREAAWRRMKAVGKEAFEAEYPETEEQALAGQPGDKCYPLAGITAAIELGRRYDELLAKGKMPEPAGGADGALATGKDFGNYTHMLPIWELEGGGVYVPPGEYASHNVEVGRKTRTFLKGLVEAGVQREVREPGERRPRWDPPLAEGRYDSAGSEAIRTFAEVIQGDPDLYRRWRFRSKGRRGIAIRILPVRFNRYKREAMNYLKYLFERSAEMLDPELPDAPTVGIIAISPLNVELIRQLRALEWKDDESGEVVKEDDHGPDALVAGAAPIAAAHREQLQREQENDPAA